MQKRILESYGICLFQAKIPATVWQLGGVIVWGVFSSWAALRK